MSIPTPTFYLVDGDPACRDSLEALIRSAGWQQEISASAEDLRQLAGDRTDLPVITIVIEQCGEVLRHAAELRELRGRYAGLSSREREVMTLVVAGLLNKQVGGRLGISEITVKAHRGKAMRKMQADSLAELVGMALRLRLSGWPGGRYLHPSSDSQLPGPISL